METIFFSKKVDDFLFSLEKSTHTKVLQDIKLLETYEYKLRMPYSKQISQNLFELRTRGKQEVRIFYCFYKSKIILLHSFIKKTKKTPPKEIKIALQRMSLLT